MLIPEWVIHLIAIASVSVSAAVAIFVFLGKKWISHLFAKELEQEKAELNKQMEHEKAKLSARTEQAKSEISFYAAKRLSLHNKEYEVFPEIWSRLSDAKASLQKALWGSRIVPDFRRMADDDFKEWLGTTNLTDNEKDAMLEARDRGYMLDRILDHRDLCRAQEISFEFETYLQKNRIFLSPEIREKFDEIEDYLRKTWAARKIHFDSAGENTGTDFRFKAIDILDEEVNPLMLEIENIIQRKFFP